MKKFTFREVETGLLYFIEAKNASQARMFLAVNLHIRYDSALEDFALVESAPIGTGLTPHALHLAELAAFAMGGGYKLTDAENFALGRLNE